MVKLGVFASSPVAVNDVMPFEVPNVGVGGVD